LTITNIKLIGYGISQLQGQLRIINGTISVSEALQSQELNAQQKEKLKLIEEIKKFTVDSLGLKPTNNYTTFYNQHNKPILYVITACKPFELTSYYWTFPLIGAVTYKGFFEKEKAQPDLEKLKKAGYDADLSPVSAWSTLGFFKDPVLSNFLKRDEGKLAELIIHELTHFTIYNKSSVEYNENLATFIGEQGAIQFITSKYGQQSLQLKNYLNYKADEELYSDHMVNGATRLDSLYKSFKPNDSIGFKIKCKKELIADIMQSLNKLPFNDKKRYFFDSTKTPLPNNTDFMVNATYRSMQGYFTGKMIAMHVDLKRFIFLFKKDENVKRPEWLK
jgi:predicted aminopeptidase